MSMTRFLINNGAQWFGSRLLGVHNHNSDYDFFIPNHRWREIKLKIRESVKQLKYLESYAGSGTFEPCYEFTYHNEKFHVVPLPEVEFQRWVVVQDMLYVLNKKLMYKKYNRVTAFQNLLNLVTNLEEDNYNDENTN